MMLFDTHAHLPDHEVDADEYCHRALEAGVGEILFCASDFSDSRRYSEFIRTNPSFYFAVGVHPHSAAEMKETVSDFRQFQTNPQLVAIGELGLDYFYDLSPRECQLRVFSDFLSLALEMDLPAVVHCRDKETSEVAYSDALDLLTPFAARGGRFELHAYAGSVEYLRKFSDLGAYFGIGGMLTFRKADNIRANALAMPRDRILLETDSPYLAPIPHRGKENHPAFLPFTASALAELYGCSVEEITEMTTRNAHRFFAKERVQK